MVVVVIDAVKLHQYVNQIGSVASGEVKGHRSSKSVQVLRLALSRGSRMRGTGRISSIPRLMKES